jgi:hypothetical protein
MTNIETLVNSESLTTETVEDLIFEIDIQLDFLLNNLKSSGRYDSLINTYTE